jgi:hypothetical protein
VEQPEVLGSGDEQNTVDLPPQQEIELDSTRAGTEYTLGQLDIGKSRAEDAMEIPNAESGDLKNLLACFLAAFNERNKALQSSVETKINQLQERVRTDIKSENEKLIKNLKWRIKN